MANGHHKLPEHIPLVKFLTLYVTILFASTARFTQPYFLPFLLYGLVRMMMASSSTKQSHLLLYSVSKFPNQGTPLFPTGLEASALF
jgi:hypothetical protein